MLPIFCLKKVILFENTKKVLVSTGYLLVPKSTFSKGYACLFSESKFAQIPDFCERHSMVESFYGNVPVIKPFTEYSHPKESFVTQRNHCFSLN